MSLINSIISSNMSIILLAKRNESHGNIIGLFRYLDFWSLFGFHPLSHYIEMLCLCVSCTVYNDVLLYVRIACSSVYGRWWTTFWSTDFLDHRQQQAVVVVCMTHPLLMQYLLLCATVIPITVPHFFSWILYFPVLLSVLPFPPRHHLHLLEWTGCWCVLFLIDFSV